jgi:ribonuclease P protein component
LSFPDAAAKGASASPSDLALVVPGKFPRAVRLTRRGDFLRIYERGVRVPGPNLVLFGVASPGGVSRIGITATRKCGGAVTRNLLKRRLREIFRAHRASLEASMDVVINVRPGADRVEFSVLREEMVGQFRELVRKVSR